MVLLSQHKNLFFIWLVLQISDSEQQHGSCEYSFDNENEKYCVIISEPQSFSNSCHREQNMTRLLQYLNDEHKDSEFWLSNIRTAAQNRNILLSQVKSKMVANYNYHQNCFKYEKGIVKIEDCEKHFREICIESKSDANLIQLACPEGSYTTRFQQYQDRCLSIEKADAKTAYNGDELFEPISSLDWIIYGQLLDLYKDKQAKCLARSGKGLLVLSRNMTTLKGFHTDALGEYSCIVFNRMLSFSEKQLPSLTLNFDRNRYEIILVAFNGEFLFHTPGSNGIKCYALHSKKHLSITQMHYTTVTPFNGDRGKTVTRTKTTYKVSFATKVPHQYQCSGRTFKNNTLIRSSTVIAYQNMSKRHLFALKIRKSFTPSDVFSLMAEPNENFWNLQAPAKEILLMQNKFIRDIYFYRIEKYEASTDQYQIILHIETDDAERGKMYKVKEDIKNIDFTEPAFNVISINSTKYCFAEDVALKERNFNWSTVEIGGIAMSNEACSDNTGKNYTRKCIGDIIMGGLWEQTSIPDSNACYQKSFITKSLEKWVTDNITSPSILIQRVADLSGRKNEIKQIDVQYMASILSPEKINGSLAQTNSINLKHTSHNLLSIVNNLMELSRTVLQDTQITSEILKMHDQSRDILSKMPNVDGKVFANETNIIELILTPSKDNITGLLLFRKKMSVKDKQNDRTSIDNSMRQPCQIIYLTHYQTEEDILRINVPDHYLEVGAHIPTDLYVSLLQAKRLQMNTSTSDIMMNISISIFLNNNLHPSSAEETPNKIIRVSIPEFQTKFNEEIRTYYQWKRMASEPCVYYNETNSWDTAGCKLVSYHAAETVVCACQHLTHFTSLLSGTNDTGSELHNTILIIITIVGGILSMFGCGGVIATAILFRRRDKTTISLEFLFISQLSVAIVMEMLWILASQFYPKSFLCLYWGALIQYITLVSFMWITALTIAIYRKFNSINKVNISNNVKIASCCCWGIPIIPTVISAISSPDLYEAENGFCYPQKDALYIFLVMPISLLLITNFIIYLKIIRAPFKIKGVTKHMDNRYYRNQRITASMSLFYHFGFTWIFGLISIVTKNLCKIIFSYIFCCTASLQGFILFICFVVCNRKVMKLWKRKFMNKPHFHRSDTGFELTNASRTLTNFRAVESEIGLR